MCKPVENVPKHNGIIDNKLEYLFFLRYSGQFPFFGYDSVQSALNYNTLLAALYTEVILSAFNKTPAELLSKAFTITQNEKAKYPPAPTTESL